MKNTILAVIAAIILVFALATGGIAAGLGLIYAALLIWLFLYGMLTRSGWHFIGYNLMFWMVTLGAGLFLFPIMLIVFCIRKGGSKPVVS